MLQRLFGRPGIRFHVLFAAVLLLLVGATVAVGIVPTRSHPYDIVFFADAGWRTLAGQRPHIDYYSPYGAGVQLLLGAGLWLAGGTIDGVGHMGACVGLVVGVWAYVLLLRRVQPLIAVTGGLLLALLCVAPVSLGFTFGYASQAMFYNRFAFAFLGLVVIEAFPLSPDSKSSTMGAISTGVACALLLFLKASYFAVAVVLAAGSLFWNPPVPLQRAWRMVLGFVVGTLPFLIYLRFRVDLLLGDLRMAAAARSAPLKISVLTGLFTQEIYQLFVLVGLGLVLGIEAGAGPMFRRLKFILLAGVLYGAGVLLMSTNAQPSRLPLDELLALLMAGAFFEIALRPKAGLQPSVAVALALVSLGITLPNAATDAAALANGLRLKRSYNRKYARTVPVGGFGPWVILDDYVLPEATLNTGRFLAPYLVDGAELLRQNLKPGELVMTMDAYNPFPFMLGIPPASGGMAAAIYPLLFNDRFHPPANFYFGNADVVIYPNQPAITEDGFRGLPKTYGAELERDFQLAAKSTLWRIYRRRPQQ